MTIEESKLIEAIENMYGGADNTKKVLMEYLVIKASDDINFAKEINEAIIVSMNNRFIKERETRVELEYGLVSALNLIDDKKLNSKKNERWSWRLKKTISDGNVKCVGMSEEEIEKYKL